MNRLVTRVTYSGMIETLKGRENVNLIMLNSIVIPSSYHNTAIIIAIIVVVVECWGTELSGCRPEFTPQAALIPIRLNKLVAPPNRSSITRLY